MERTVYQKLIEWNIYKQRMTFKLRHNTFRHENERLNTKYNKA